MGFYTLSPFKPSPKLLVAGTPEYLFGSFNSDTGPTTGPLLQDASNGTTTGTFVFQIISGNIPSLGDLLTVIGATNSANFNVTNATILSVACTTAGICTVTAAITSTATPTTLTADNGYVLIPRSEVGTTLTVSGTQSSEPAASPASPSQQSGKSLSTTVTLPANSTPIPSTLSGITVVLQGANVDIDSQYNTIATVATSVSAGSFTDWQSGQGNTGTGTLAAGSVNLPNFRFYRFQTSGGSGTGPIIAKIME